MSTPFSSSPASPVRRLHRRMRRRMRRNRRNRAPGYTWWALVGAMMLAIATVGLVSLALV